MFLQEGTQVEQNINDLLHITISIIITALMRESLSTLSARSLYFPLCQHPEGCSGKQQSSISCLEVIGALFTETLTSGEFAAVRLGALGDTDGPDTACSLTAQPAAVLAATFLACRVIDSVI